LAAKLYSRSIILIDKNSQILRFGVHAILEKMTVTPSTSLPSTIAVIILLAALAFVPVIFYLRIILKFVLDKELQAELAGRESAWSTNKTPSTIPAPQQVLVTFKDVTYTVRKTQKQILKGVSGYFAPKTLTAILGTSGSLRFYFSPPTTTTTR
jgi:ABC-type multidrug transport system fused ATPase/permease subunit